MEIKIPFENNHKQGNYFGHKVCYKCNQVYDARFSICINCGSDVWGNLNSYNNINGNIYVNKVPPRYCTGCDFILLKGEHFEDEEGNEYCEKCKNQIEIVGEDSA